MLNKTELAQLMLELGGKGNDNVLDHYIQRAYNAIKSHLNYTDEEMVGNFESEIVDLALFWNKNKDKTGKIQMSQGSRSETIEKGIPKNILDSLPLPRVRVVG